MKDTITNILFLCIGVVIAVLCYRSCSPEPQVVTKVERHDTTIVIHDTIFQGEGKGKLKFTYSGVFIDTVYRNDSIYITVRDTSHFIATLDTIQNGDSLHLEYYHPSALFRYHLNRQADSVSVVYTTTTNTVTIEPPKFSVGVQVGFGYLISWRTGQTAIGSYVGVGANYKL